MNIDDLSKILAAHSGWLSNNGGCRADLSGADLSGANLSGAALSGASLTGANLTGADLTGANLSLANLSLANLSGANISLANISLANLSGADLTGANISLANLSGANLSGAALSGASLTGASLTGASLTGANISGANLSGANLSGAIGVRKETSTPLMMLMDQPGPIRAYKLVTSDLTGPYYAGIVYAIGADVSADDASTDDAKQCGPGISVATLDWCLREWRNGYRVMILEFTAADIACIPIATDGKFRLWRGKVVGEKDLTGLVPTQEASR